MKNIFKTAIILKSITLVSLFIVLSCTSSNQNITSTDSGFENYFENNSTLYQGFKSECERMYDKVNMSEESKTKYCNCIPKAVALCVYKEQTISGTKITQIDYKSCVVSGKDSCSQTYVQQATGLLESLNLF